MKSMVLAAAAGIAAIALFAGSAQAESIGRTQHRLTRIFGAPAQPFNCGGSGSRHTVVVCGDGVGSWYGGEWALYNNRSWDADSYNDWWHDRPERAYPAWMRRNQDCARQWYSGDTLTC